MKELKVLMLAEYFPPFDFGGSEWSIYCLAKGLSKMNCKISVLTPNYGKVVSTEIIHGFKVIRFPFYKKIKGKKTLSPIWQTNILWILITTFYTLMYCVKNKIDVVHVQGKYFLPSAFFTKILLGRRFVITLRDYTILCPLGMCVLEKRKVCSLSEYFFSDIPKYYRLYQVDKSSISKIIQLIAALRARVTSYFLKFLLQFADEKIAVSKLTKKIYQTAGVKNIRVIYNCVEISNNLAKKRRDEIVFAGRLTPGKGPQLIIESLPKVLEKFPKVKTFFLGDGFLKRNLKQRAKTLGIDKNTIFSGHRSHDEVISKISKAKITLIPSVWPEPLSRAGLESLSLGTPVVISHNTGNAEFFKDKAWGYISETNSTSLSNAILYSLKNNNTLLNNIRNDSTKISTSLNHEVYTNYLKAYIQ